MKSHEVLKQVILAVGAKRLASHLKISSSLVHKWCADPVVDGECGSGGARNPLDCVVDLCENTGDRRPIEWLCQAVGGHFVEDPDVDSRGSRLQVNEAHNPAG